MPPSVYLAGPDVFLPDPAARGAALRAICARHGLRGLWPMDPPPGTAPPETPAAIAAACEAHIRGADAVIANLTPFRGIAADPGTVYEVGFARGLGKPVWGWTATAATLAERTRALPGSRADADADADGLSVESFGLPENLMVVCGIQASGGVVLAEACDPWAELGPFTRCVALAAARLLSRAA